MDGGVVSEVATKPPLVPSPPQSLLSHFPFAPPLPPASTIAAPPLPFWLPPSPERGVAGEAPKPWYECSLAANSARVAAISASSSLGRTKWRLSNDSAPTPI